MNFEVDIKNELYNETTLTNLKNYIISEKKNNLAKNAKADDEINSKSSSKKKQCKELHIKSEIMENYNKKAMVKERYQTELIKIDSKNMVELKQRVNSESGEVLVANSIDNMFDGSYESDSEKDIAPYLCEIIEGSCQPKNSGEKILLCPTCEKIFLNPVKLRKHQRVHIKDKTYQCSDCNKLFTHRSNYSRHLLVHSRPFACSDCNKNFAQTRDLQHHRLTHSGQKPFQCPDCEKCFAQQAYLKKHQNIHTGDKSCFCRICFKRFGHSSTLKTHMLSHSGIKPFQCPECSKCFTDRSNLRKHKLIHAGIKPFACEQCFMKFTQLGTLKRHLLTHSDK